jgi:O-acetyl-ADP-ribose deacetylase (regulator of RNase III)
MNTPKIIFFDINKNAIKQYEDILKMKIPNSLFIHCDLNDLVQKYAEINAIISPANSYGFMNGGIDRNINEILDNIEKDVQNRINIVGLYDNSGRKYLPIGKCEVIMKNNKYLYVAPTMVMPSKLPKDTINISLAFHAILCQSKQYQHKHIIACPCLGTGVGQLDPYISANQILNAYKYFMSNN